MKKCKITFPFNISRKYFHFLIFLLAFSFSKAICKPEDAYAENLKENSSKPEKIYISGEATIFVAEGTVIAGSELLQTDVKKTKTHPLKKKAEKLKLVKRTTPVTKPAIANKPIETISSTKSKYSWESYASYNGKASITYNNSFKSFVALEQNTFISIIFSVLIILILFYRSRITRAMLLLVNFQLPPPSALF